MGQRWVPVRTLVELIGVPIRGEDREDVVPPGRWIELPESDAARQERRDQVEYPKNETPDTGESDGPPNT